MYKPNLIQIKIVNKKNPRPSASTSKSTPALKTQQESDYWVERVFVVMFVVTFLWYFSDIEYDALVTNWYFPRFPPHTEWRIGYIISWSHCKAKTSTTVHAAKARCHSRIPKYNVLGVTLLMTLMFLNTLLRRLKSHRFRWKRWSFQEQ